MGGNGNILDVGTLKRGVMFDEGCDERHPDFGKVELIELLWEQCL
jgi:hypothetical protein